MSLLSIRTLDLIIGSGLSRRAQDALIASIERDIVDCRRAMTPKPRTTPKRPRGVHVYVMADSHTDHVKIGISITPRSRLAAIEGARGGFLRLAYQSPPYDGRIARRIERDAHDHLEDDFGVGHEWFTCGAEAAIHTVKMLERSMLQSQYEEPVL